MSKIIMTENDTSTHDIERCHECGGGVVSEIEGNFEDWRCQDCGIIVAGGRLVDADSDRSSVD